jgi:L-ascorbate metabolism protein UlaG (beta-lactamase superfamily)
MSFSSQPSIIRSMRVKSIRPGLRLDRRLARITWIGHSTVLIEMDGVRLLTDPLLRRRVLHLRRVVADAAELGELDAVLISHGHADHLDAGSLEHLDVARVIAPPGVALRVHGWADDVVELGLGEELEVGAVRVTATAAEHGAGAVGYLASGSARIYFAGDTDLFDGMRELAPGLDVALLPIGGWGPRVPAGHLDPLRAAQALELLRPRIAVPIHWGTYRRIGLSRDESAPAKQFVELAAEHAPDVDVRVLPVGGSLEVPLEACV